MLRWLRRWFRCRNAPASRPRYNSATKKNHFQPRMEKLEDRTTPAPLSADVTGIVANLGGGSDLGVGNPAAVPTTNAGLEQTPVAVSGAIAAGQFPPMVVNSLDQAILELSAAATLGMNATLATLPELEFELLQNPDSNASLAAGVPAAEVFAELSPWGNAAELLADPSPTPLPAAADAFATFHLLPTGLRGPAQPYALPSSGTTLGGLPTAEPPAAAAPPDRSALLRTAPESAASASSIAGTLYRDQNGNGIRDKGELAMTGVNVTLEVEHDDGYRVVAIAVSDANGQYSFPGLAKGNYRIRPEAPAGFRLEQNPRSVALRAFASLGGQDFGLAPATEQESKPAEPVSDDQQDSASNADTSLLDRAFATWQDDERLPAVIDHVFAEASMEADVAITAQTIDTALQSYVAEEPASPCEPANRLLAGVMFVGTAAAAAIEFDRTPGGDRFWEDYERDWLEEETLEPVAVA